MSIFVTVGTFYTVGTFQDIPLPLLGKVFAGAESLELFDPTDFAIVELHSNFMWHDLNNFHWASSAFHQKMFLKA